MTKVLSTIVVLVMVLSSVAVISAATIGAPAKTVPASAAAAGPAPPASGTITLSVTTFARNNVTNSTTTLSVASGGSFGQGATLSFCFSRTTTFDSATVTPFGTFPLPASQTSLSDAVVSLGATGQPASFPATSPAAGYVSATDNLGGCGSLGATYVNPVAISIPVSPSPIFQLTPSTVQAGSSAPILGTGWDAGATVTVTLSGATSSAFPQSFTADANGNLAGAALSVPLDLAAGTYNLVATETAPAAGALYGITVTSAMTITPYVTASPASINGNAGDSLTVSGYGFPAAALIKADWITVNTEDIAGYTFGQSTGTTHAARTVASNGQFSVTVTLNVSINSGGDGYIGGGLGDVKVFWGPAEVSSYTQLAAFFVSNPNLAEMGLIFQDTATMNTFGSSGDPLSVQIWNWFPAGATVTIYMASINVGTIVTDSFGFGTLSTTVPVLSGGSYLVRAASSPYTVTGPSPSTFTISSFFQAVDPTAAPLMGEYLPSDGLITIQAYGLSASTEYTALDYQVSEYYGQDVVTAGAAGNLLAFSISVGTLAGDQAGIFPAANGTIVFTYSPSFFGDSSNGTGANTGITFGPSPAGSGVTPLNGAGYNYSAVDDLSQGLGISNFVQVIGGLLYVNETDLIPAGATSFYPGISNVYNFYWGTTELANKTGVTDFTATPGYGAWGHEFTPKLFSLVLPPGLADGIQSVGFSYQGQGAAAELDYSNVLGSLPGTSVNSGAIHFMPGNDPGSGDGYGFLAYDLQPRVHVYVYYSTVSGVINASAYDCVHGANGGGPITTVPAYGAIKAQLGDCTIGLPVNLNPAGTYAAWVVQWNSTSHSTGTIQTTFPIVASASVIDDGAFDPACSQNYVTLGYCAYSAGDSVGMVLNGLDISSSYDVYFGSTWVSTNVTDTLGGAGWLYFWYDESFSEYTPWYFTVPTVVPGAYTVSVVPTGMPLSDAVVTTTVVVLGSPTISLFTGSVDQSYAFPGELLSYSWNPGIGNLPDSTLPFTVTVWLNDTPYQPQPGTLVGTTIYGSFTMPNVCANSANTCTGGSYWWATLSWSQVGSGYALLNGFTDPSTSFLQVVSGNGAFLTGVTPDQIAEITTAVNQTLEVPIAELNAAVVSIENATATIVTSFGTLQATLASINATVTGIENGVANVQTTLGMVTVSLSDLDAQITAIGTSVSSIGDTLVTITTSLGTMTTTLAGIDATVSSTATAVSGLVGSVATITTTLGTISGTVTSIDGTVAMIQTQLGTVAVQVGQIQTSTSNAASQNSVNTATYLLYAVVALVILVLILLALMMMMASRMRPPKAPPAAYTGPSSQPPSSGGSSGSP